MPSIESLLDQLEDAKRRFDSQGAALVTKLLRSLSRRRFSDVEQLIRFHESLLFARAHPAGPEIFQLAEDLLSSFDSCVERLLASGIDPAEFDYIQYSGIAGTLLSGTFSYDIARWLVSRYPGRADIKWEEYKHPEKLASVLPRLLPLFYEDSLVEANIPYREWLRAATGENNSLKWIVERFEQLSISDREKTLIYNSLELPIRWEMKDSDASRTNNRKTPRNVFFHTEPLIGRRDVSLPAELDSAPVPLEKLSKSEGEEIIGRARATISVRYRELYGITHGDGRSVVRADLGRGVKMFLWGLPLERRLPLRAYHAGFTLKNGVPINYIEGITLFERMEVGFNTFYTYREGESAWVYVRALKLLGQVAGATCFSIDPYQIGHHNDEAIESGAFWFYRKLGFRPTRPDLIRLAEREEKKIAADSAYRTTPRTLRRLATEPAIYEHNPTGGEWDQFRIRNIGLAVQRQLSGAFSGDPEKMRAQSVTRVARLLDIDPTEMHASERTFFEDFSFALALVPDLEKWTDQEKLKLAKIIRAKAERDESRYARLLQKHARLRRAMISIGSEK